MLRIALDEGLEAALGAGVVAVLQELEGIVIDLLALARQPPPAAALAAGPLGGGGGAAAAGAGGRAGRPPPLPFSSWSRRNS